MTPEDIARCLQSPRYNVDHLLIDEIHHIKKEVFIQACKVNQKPHENGWTVVKSIEGIIQCVLIMIYDEDPYRRVVFREITQLNTKNLPQYFDATIYRVWQIGSTNRIRRYLGTAFFDQKLIVRATLSFEVV